MDVTRRESNVAVSRRDALKLAGASLWLGVGASPPFSTACQTDTFNSPW